MNNDLAYILFATLFLACFVTLTIKVGFIPACLITLVLVVLIPKEFYVLLLGMMGLIINMTLLKWMFIYWPVTLILGLWYWLATQNKSESKTKPQEESSCKRLS